MSAVTVIEMTNLAAQMPKGNMRGYTERAEAEAEAARTGQPYIYHQPSPSTWYVVAQGGRND